MDSTEIGYLFESTNVFNTLAGNLDNDLRQSFELQRNLVKEEFQELSDGFDTDNISEQLDGCVDVLVTTFGYLQKLKATYGIDIGKACNLIAENNLSKFLDTEDQVMETIEFYKSQGIDVVWEYNQNLKKYVIKDAKTGKVKKPKGFVSVSLDECFPTRN